MTAEWEPQEDATFIERAPGQSAREKEAQLGEEKSRLRVFAERALDVPTEDRNWRRGAEGEERVGVKLEKLGAPHWRVVHDLPIGARGANLDHLLIGPGGVFSINTKNLRGRISITPTGVFQNGRGHRIVPSARAEAAKVQGLLRVATGLPVDVTPMLVLVTALRDPDPKIEGRPSGVEVIFVEGLRLWFWRRRKAWVLGAGAIAQIEAAARRPRTWHAGSAPSTPATAPKPARPTPPASPASSPLPPPEVTVTRWRRFGHDRIYVNRDVAAIGYLDLATGLVHVEQEADRDLVTDATRRWSDATGGDGSEESHHA